MRNVLLCLLATLCLAATAAAGDEIELRFPDGSRWVGTTGTPVVVEYRHSGKNVEIVGSIVREGSLYVVVEGTIGGLPSTVTIFKSDLISVRNDRNAEAAPARSAARPKTKDRGDAKPDAPVEPAATDASFPRVFILPLEGMVGTYIRNDEIQEIGKEADKYGQGQIIILRIKSNGGSAIEAEEIADDIFELRKRHRVIAWVEKAISAGCSTAMCCSEIYFMTEGSAGAVTTWDGRGTSIKGEELERAKAHLADIAERSGYSRYIAHAMKTNSAMCSYDKDPETGEITWYGDLSGEFVLSDSNSNLSFTSSTALHCGFSKGTADTEEELAAFLDLPESIQFEEAGRRIAEDWQRTVEQAEKEIPRLVARLSYYKSAGSAEEQIGARIKIYKDLIQWWNRCPTVMQMNGLPPKEVLQREIKEMQKRLADMRR